MLGSQLRHDHGSTHSLAAVQRKVGEDEGNSFGTLSLSGPASCRHHVVQVGCLARAFPQLNSTIFRATHVPVGEDQLQHLQLAQSLAKNFNNRFGKTFPMCQPMVAEDASSRIKSLRDPSKKMSKSDPDTKSCVMITDKPDVIVEKIKKAITDCKSEVTYEPETRPGVTNLLTIHSMVSGKSIEQICREAEGLDTGK